LTFTDLAGRIKKARCLMSQENEKKGMSPEEIREYHARVKKEFRAKYLEKFFVEEEGIPLGDFIKDMEESFRKPKAGEDAA
jgi:hypothetical protein